MPQFSPDYATAPSPPPLGGPCSEGYPEGRHGDWPEGTELTEGLGLAGCPHSCSASVYTCMHIHMRTQPCPLATSLSEEADGWQEGSTGFAVDPGP